MNDIIRDMHSQMGYKLGNRWRRACAGFTGIAVCLVALAGSAQAVSPSDSFCDQPVSPSYEEIFQRLPAVNSLPRSGKLPFAPKAVRVQSSPDAVLVGPAGVGYNLFMESPKSSRHLRLGWTMSVQARTIGRDGDTGQIVASAQQSVDTLTKSSVVSVGVNLAAKPRIYLIELILKSRNGRILGTYQRYARVVRPKSAARLVLSDPAFASGEEAIFRVENLGTLDVELFGEEFALERYDGTHWFLDPASPEAFTKPKLGTVSAGAAGFCRSFVIPTSVAPGHYRFSKMVGISGKGRRMQLTATFDVRPAS